LATIAVSGRVGGQMRGCGEMVGVLSGNPYESPIF
jgi:hypothetical protein